MAHESAIVPSSNVKDGDESENEIDLEEGEIEDGELPEEGETRTFDHQEITVPLKIEQKLQQRPTPIAKLEPRAPLLPLPTRHPNSTIKRRPLPQRNYNSRHILKEEEPEDDDWASTLERALAQKAALASENANAKIKHLTSEINEEDNRNSNDEENEEEKEEDDKKLRRKKRKKKFRDDEENDGDPKESKRRRKSHHKRTDMSWECKDEDEEEDGDEDEMLFVRGASPTVRNIYHDDDDDSPRNFQDDSYSYSDQGEIYDESYGSYGEHKEDDDDDFDIRGSFSRRGPRDDEDEDRHLNCGLKRRARGLSIVRGGSDRMQLTKRLSSRREGVVKPRGGKRSNSHGPQERDSVCLFFMQGKCHRGNDCPYSHDAMPQKKLELCKFYLMDCCAKKDKCLYMHQSFPCKFYHTGMKCYSGSRCKFSHGKLTDQMKSILLKHLETSPKDCVGDFPRVNREGSTGVNYNKKSASRPNKPSSKKIPSLFDIEVPVYVQRMAEKKDVDTDEQSPPQRTTPMPESDVEDQEDQETPVLSSPKTERRSSSRTKSSRWNKEDSPTYNNSRDGNSERTPERKSKYNRDEIEDCDEKPVLRFYQETLSSDEMDHKEFSEMTFGDSKSKRELNLHRLAGYSPKSSSDTEESHKSRETLGTTKTSDTFDSKTMIGAGIDGKCDKLDQVELAPDTRESQPETGGESGTESNDGANVPLHLPKKQRELFLRIQQQQREAENSKDTTGDNEDDEDNCRDENWYSSDDEEVPLTDVLKNLSQQEQQQKQEQLNLEEKQQEQKQSELPSIKDTIASCVAGVGFPDLSQIKISESVTKILSSIRHQGITPINVSPSASISSAALDTTEAAQTEKLPSQLQSPTPIARDPRLSRDPRSRSTSVVGSCQGLASPTSTSEVSTPSARRQDPRSNRMDPRKSNSSPGEEARASVGPSRRGSFTSIYSNAITTPSDTDLRNFVPQQDTRTADVDLRQTHDTDFRINYAAKDTDLRPKLIDDILSEADNSGHIGDVDLRRMLELPFKPVPMHTPATEIDASLTSHPPIPYKVVEVTIPRPDYTNLKLNTSDPQVENDPRLRKIFKLPTTTATTTNASTVKPATSTLSSATSIAPRTDPRRLSARGRTHATTIPSSVSTPIPTPIMTPTPPIISPDTLPFPHQPEIPLHTGPLLPTPNILPNMDPRILRGNTRNNSPGLLGAAPAGFCPPTPRFEEESDDGAMYQNSWNMHQAQRKNWRGGLRSQQARYMEQDFGNRQGLKSFTPPL